MGMGWGLVGLVQLGGVLELGEAGGMGLPREREFLGVLMMGCRRRYWIRCVRWMRCLGWVRSRRWTYVETTFG